jgi:hypothetical protein
VIRKRTSGLGCLDGRDFANEVPAPGQDEITIYDRRTVGIYQTLTIGADDSRALTDSLTAWGFLHEQNERTIADALQFYIDKSWYFVAMKTDTSTIWERRTPEPYWYGGIDPIRLSFASPEIIYPMRISAVSADRVSEILLYVCTAHRVSFTGASTEYANQITRYELLGIRADYPALEPYLTRPCFMTKLRKTFLASEMGDDITFQRAPNDHEYREIRYTGVASGDAALLALAGLFIARRWRRRSGARGPRDPAPGQGLDSAEPISPFAAQTRCGESPRLGASCPEPSGIHMSIS